MLTVRLIVLIHSFIHFMFNHRTYQVPGYRVKGQARPLVASKWFLSGDRVKGEKKERSTQIKIIGACWKCWGLSWIVTEDVLRKRGPTSGRPGARADI